MSSAGLIAAVAAGGAIGAVLRFLVTTAALSVMGPRFPWGTLTVNILGSFAIGLAAAFFARHLGDPAGWRAFVMTGILGGFTTFSAFSLDVLVLAERQHWVPAIAYLGASVVLSILALVLGLLAMRAVLSGSITA